MPESVESEHRNECVDACARRTKKEGKIAGNYESLMNEKGIADRRRPKSERKEKGEGGNVFNSFPGV